MTECDNVLRGEIKQELSREIKGILRTSRGEVRRFSGTEVIPEQMSFQEEAEPGCGGGYHHIRGNREEVKTGDKVMKVEADIFEITTTAKLS